MLNKNRKEAYEHINKIAVMLGCDTENVVMSHINPLTKEYQTDPDFADRLIRSEGIYPMLESHYRKHGTYNNWNVGLHLYETRYSKVQYCIIAFPSEQGQIAQYVFVAKGNMFRLMRASKRQENDYERSSCKMPILDSQFIQQILDNTIVFLDNSEKLASYGAKLKRGIILSGAPGNGKTMLCKYISSLATIKGYDCTNISAPHIEKAFAEGNLPHLLNQTGFLFIDDVDIAYFDRRDGRPKASIACSLLSAMDGIEGNGNVVRIFTTNEDLENMDKAFLRPGRIDKFFCFTNPAPDLRKKFILTWHKDIVKYINDSDAIDTIVDNTDGLSFAEMDLVRTSLVEEFIQDGKWDIDKALETTKSRLENRASNPPQKKIGFGGAIAKKKNVRRVGKLNEGAPNRHFDDDDDDDGYDLEDL